MKNHYIAAKFRQESSTDAKGMERGGRGDLDKMKNSEESQKQLEIK